MKGDPLPALIVAHGQPSDPAPAAAELARLAAQVAQSAAGRVIAAATLAEEGALGQALSRLGPRGVIFPMFMAGGWFTRVALAKRVQEAGGHEWQVLEPFGCEAALHALARDILAEALTGQDIARAEVLIAAHGSFKSSAPADVARALAAKVQGDLGLARVEVGFIDQTPQLRDATGFGAGAICLPFFAANGGHVTTDLPAALAEARFGGRVLPALGLDARVPALIAAAIARARPICAQSCRHSAPSAP